MKHFRLSGFVLFAAIAVAPCVALAQGYNGQNNGQGYNGQSNGGYQNGGYSTSGVIAVVNGTNIKLQDGRNIFLKNGTVINPTGTRLVPGMRIYVQGWHGGNGAINASNIQVRGYGGHGNNNGGSYNNNNYNNNNNNYNNGH
ncbi:MAG TPA: hypothetical protein VKG44_08305 [Candidatus Baltobacteraceae bacterium]|nr:hypothetical protein [Candidatus Baltobacteraceae bacterium]